MVNVIFFLSFSFHSPRRSLFYAYFPSNELRYLSCLGGLFEVFFFLFFVIVNVFYSILFRSVSWRSVFFFRYFDFSFCVLLNE